MTSPQPFDPQTSPGGSNLPADLPLQQSPNREQRRQDPDKPPQMPQKTVAHVERNRGGFLPWFIITVIVLALIVLAAWFVSP